MLVDYKVGLLKALADDTYAIEYLLEVYKEVVDTYEIDKIFTAIKDIDTAQEYKQ